MSDETSTRKIPVAESFDHIRERLEQIKREENREGDQPQPKFEYSYHGWGFSK